jgi:hypothetical protein
VAALPVVVGNVVCLADAGHAAVGLEYEVLARGAGVELDRGDAAEAQCGENGDEALHGFGGSVGSENPGPGFWSGHAPTPAPT